MQSFIAIHSNNNGPAFSTFDSIMAAKDHLQGLILSHQVRDSDTLAIVRSCDDSIVYFKQRNNTIASLNAALNPSRNGSWKSTQSVYQVAKEQLVLVFASLTNAVSRR